jgi:kynurenine formamidase
MAGHPGRADRAGRGDGGHRCRAAHSFEPPFPCHASLLGAGKYGLTQLQNLARLPPRGAMVIAGPLPITGGPGSPCRALTLVEHG